MTKHHVPDHIADLILDYCDQSKMRVSARSVTLECNNLDGGIITCCNMSVTLYALAMNIIIKSVEPECRGSQTKSGTYQPAGGSFNNWKSLFWWSLMGFKPSKSRSLCVIHRFCFGIEGTPIPSISSTAASRTLQLLRQPDRN